VEQLEIPDQKGSRHSVLAVDRHVMAEDRDAGGRVLGDRAAAARILAARIPDPNAIASTK